MKVWIGEVISDVMPEHDFWVRVTDLSRAQEWREVVGDDVVPVMSPMPQRADLPGRPDSLVYLVALDLLPPGAVDRIAAHVTKKFNLPEPVTAADLRLQGLPLLANDCAVMILNFQKWM